MTKKIAVTAALAVASATLPFVLTTAPAAAAPGGCSARAIVGAPYPGAESVCTSGTGQHRVILACKSSQLGGTTQVYVGVWKGIGQVSRTFCTASYPVRASFYIETTA
jgi:hypothetical protein